MRHKGTTLPRKIPRSLDADSVCTGNDDMAASVNLDALIPREDFEVTADARPSWRKTETLQVHELEAKRFTYNALRKPDFQRETASWSPEKVQDLVKTFLDGDLIPAIIFWESAGNIFVIDGSHRLSALIAWVQDDYGEGPKSREFFQNRIPDEQVRAGDRTRELLKSSVGTYKEHQLAVEHPDPTRPEVLARARRMASLALQLQWVPAGDAKQAEESFFKINQQATPIDPNELRIIRARHSPNALASRVVVRSATGHAYWQPFESRRADIEGLGREIFPLLFEPSFENPVKTLALPVAGKSGQALPLLFDFVNLANDVPVVDATRKHPDRKPETPLPKDEDGKKTLDFLNRTKGLANRLAGIDPSSLGYDPVVYFYSLTGRHQPTSFLAVAAFTLDLIKNDELRGFTKHRKDFEEFLLRHKNFINQIVTKRGSGAKGYTWIRTFYHIVLNALKDGLDEKSILARFKRNPDFSFLSTIEVDDDAIVNGTSKRFSRATKSQAFIVEALNSALKCSICGARMHARSIQVDHAERLRDGGAGNLLNARLAHPYCNSTFKN